MTTDTDLPAAVADPALEAFMDYFRRNYPGPDTIIGRPDWHSPKIFRAAVHAMKASGDLVPRADVEGLVEIGNAIAAHDARPEYNGRYMELRALIDRMRAALTAWENRNDR